MHEYKKSSHIDSMYVKSDNVLQEFDEEGNLVKVTTVIEYAKKAPKFTLNINSSGMQI